MADRNAIEGLAGLIESLHRENRELNVENQKLVSSQIREYYSQLYLAENQGTQLLVLKIQEIQKDLYARLEHMSDLICRRIADMSLTEQKMENDLAELRMAVNDMAKMQEKNQAEIRSAFSSESVRLEEGRNCLERAIAAEGASSRKAIYEDIRKQVSCIFEKQQKLSSDSCKVIADANKELIIRIEQYCTMMLEEIKDTAENYRQMERDGQENLDKIRVLSGEMLELGEHQKKIMEQLSVLCQNSDQFMEIQKSINNMWEIMKAVWVDSLLSDYETGLNGGICKDSDLKTAEDIKQGEAYE